MGMYPKGTKKFFHEYTISVEDMGPLVSELKKIFPQIIKIDLPEDKNMDCYLLDPDPPDEKEITKRITLYVAMTKPHGGHCIVGYDDFDEGIKLRNEGLLFGMYAGEYSPLYHLRHTLAIKGITAVSLPVQENEMMPDLLALPVGLKYELQFR